MIDAKKVYQATVQVNRNKYEKELDKIDHMIQEAINNGEFEIEVDDLSDYVRNILIDLNYKVELHENNCAFTNYYSYYTINWEGPY